jgi:hypothetical protein
MKCCGHVTAKQETALLTVVTGDSISVQTGCTAGEVNGEVTDSDNRAEELDGASRTTATGATFTAGTAGATCAASATGAARSSIIITSCAAAATGAVASDTASTATPTRTARSRIMVRMATARTTTAAGEAQAARVGVGIPRGTCPIPGGTALSRESNGFHTQPTECDDLHGAATITASTPLVAGAASTACATAARAAATGATFATIVIAATFAATATATGAACATAAAAACAAGTPTTTGATAGDGGGMVGISKVHATKTGMARFTVTARLTNRARGACCARAAVAVPLGAS